MTLEERIAALEQRRIDLDHIERVLDEHSRILGRILLTLEQQDATLRNIAATLPRLGFRWPWEARP